MPIETVFLSYVAEDAAVVAQLKSDLTRAGVSVVDRASLVKPGYRLKASVKLAVESASHFVLCLASRDGLPPGYAQDELNVAIKAERSIIPVRLTRCDIPAVPLDDSVTIADIEAVDLYDDWRGGLGRLISTLPASLPPQETGGAKRIRFRTKSLDANHFVMNGEDIDVHVDGETRISGTLTGSNE